MKKFDFVLPKGQMISFLRKGVFSGNMFDFTQDIEFQVEIFGTNDIQFILSDKYKRIVFYADSVKLEGIFITEVLLNTEVKIDE